MRAGSALGLALLLVAVAGCVSLGTPAGGATREERTFVVDRIEATQYRGTVVVLEGFDGMYDVPGELLPIELSEGQSIELDPRWVKRVSL